MLFNSLDFAVFLPVVFLLYWAVPMGIRQRNLYLLALSYLFYGWWDARFLILIAFSSLVDFEVGRALGRTSDRSRRGWLLALSVIINLGLLGFFKYFNFFLDNFVSAFSLLGVPFDPVRLSIVLPVGISFYTFQTLSYTIDVYRGRLEPTRDPIAFFAFVSFFPQLVAGPIERAVALLPQFAEKHRFDRDKATDGLRRILWGLFKKVVVADSCAVYVDLIFERPESVSGAELFVGALLFAFQIYGDFSGYSDIAIGTARLFGFELMKNFALPYFSRDVAEFWRRWHISLSTWFRDYVYIPLGGSRGSQWVRIRNTAAVFLVSGLWHGANWTFFIWGALHALFFLPLLLWSDHRRHTDLVAAYGRFPSLRELGGMLRTAFLVTLAWIFFRSEDLHQAITIYGRIFGPDLLGPFLFAPKRPVVYIFMLLLLEWITRRDEHPLSKLASDRPAFVRWGMYYGLLLLIVISSGREQPFIYFQF
ncbi:MAG: MBOAT family protein [Flavobacteriales bacterium]|nr:MBOAT family protein [Flavobacteriales bacterium]